MKDLFINKTFKDQTLFRGSSINDKIKHSFSFNNEIKNQTCKSEYKRLENLYS